jgi:hypothetical protein
VKDVRGHHVPLTVVAAKKPGEWIVRAWACFVDPQPLREMVLDEIGRLDGEGVEWTTHTYDLPAWLVYEPGEIGWQAGVAIWEHTTSDQYRNPRMLREPRKPVGGMAAQFQKAVP